MWFAYLLGIVIGLVIDYFVAQKFAEIAEMKGHIGNTYFWYTFFLGVVGMLMVIALPDVSKKEVPQAPIVVPAANLSVQEENPLVESDQAENSTATEDNAKDTAKENAPLTAEIVNGEKICPNCKLPQKATRTVCWQCGQRFDN